MWLVKSQLRVLARPFVVMFGLLPFLGICLLEGADFADLAMAQHLRGTKTQQLSHA